jgi:hypothetical protein
VKTTALLPLSNARSKDPFHCTPTPSLLALHQYLTVVTQQSFNVATISKMHAKVPPANVFGDLRGAINPYVDDILRPLQFHRFLDLPTELRSNIYRHYFDDETRAAAYRNSPYISLASTFQFNDLNYRKDRPILPLICFTNRTTRQEAINLILGVVTPELFYYSPISDISLLAAACYGNDVRIRDHIHSVSLIQINACYRIRLRPGSIWRKGISQCVNAKASNLLMNACFDNLRQLALI